jgi:hypothetical protein
MFKSYHNWVWLAILNIYNIIYLMSYHIVEKLYVNKEKKKSCILINYLSFIRDDNLC